MIGKSFWALRRKRTGTFEPMLYKSAAAAQAKADQNGMFDVVPLTAAPVREEGGADWRSEYNRVEAIREAAEGQDRIARGTTDPIAKSDAETQAAGYWKRYEREIAKLNALATREEAPAEAGERLTKIANSMNLVLSGGWDEDQDCDWGAKPDEAKLDRLDNLLGDFLEALRAQPPAREDAQPWGHAVRFLDNGWKLASDLAPDYFEAVKHDPKWTVQPLYTHPATDALREHERLFNVLRDHSWDLRCFNIPTGGDDYDIGWRVVGHWQAEPRERTIAEVFSDDPAEAVRQARAALQAEQKGGV